MAVLIGRIWKMEVARMKLEKGSQDRGTSKLEVVLEAGGPSGPLGAYTATKWPVPGGRELETETGVSSGLLDEELDAERLTLRCCIVGIQRRGVDHSEIIPKLRRPAGLERGGESGTRKELLDESARVKRPARQDASEEGAELVGVDCSGTAPKLERPARRGKAVEVEIPSRLFGSRDEPKQPAPGCSEA